MADNKKKRKTNKEVWQEAKKEGMFSEAFTLVNTKKKYKFKSAKDGIVSIALMFLAVVLISWVSSW